MTEIEDETMIVGISGMQEVIRAVREGIEDVVEEEGVIVIETAVTVLTILLSSWIPLRSRPALIFCGKSNCSRVTSLEVR